MVLVSWLGIVFCITQSAVFSGLNLAFFSLTKLRLTIEVAKGNVKAEKILKMREDSNFLLTTILWGNVGINVLLALLSNSVMTGMMAFLFSTFLITFLGEIIPQAYFSRHAIKMAYALTPVIRFYQVLLFLLAKPSSLILDKWLGPEAVHFFQEDDFEEMIKLHMRSSESDIANIEGRGALNFLAFDDLPITSEGEIVNPESIIQMTFQDDKPVYPLENGSLSSDFIHKIQLSGKKWIIVTDMENEPRLVLNSDNLIRKSLFSTGGSNFRECGHRPIIIRDSRKKLGETISLLKVTSGEADDDVIEKDIILYWGEQKKIITGADILGRLLKGIVKTETF
ncbi:DUF21 domain-containing protein [bacterium]|nr:DUF21 domain-containing protein [bacterium]